MASEVKTRAYVGKPTLAGQILTSLKTVFTGFALASLVASPLGILAGLSATANARSSPGCRCSSPYPPRPGCPS